MNKKVLITGGSGYFGETLTQKLIDKGYDCSIYDLNKPSNDLIKNVKYFDGDIRDFDKVNKACKDIEIIFHNVAQVPIAKNKYLFESVNNIGTKNILDAAKNNKCEHFIYTSSSAIYGVPKENPVNELTMPSPVEAYGKAKLDGENACIAYENNFKVTTIRPRTILGGGRLGIFQILFEWIYQNQNIPVFDNGDNIYQFVHTEDLAEACIQTMILQKSGAFNIGAKNYGSMRETLQFLLDNSNKKSSIRSIQSKKVIPFMHLASKLGISPLGPYHAKMYGKSMYFDITKSEDILNWTPKYSNKEMILQSYNWYISNREEILNPKTNLSAHKSAMKQKVLWLVGKYLL
jgi:nucleoside-diphosphate-sugar epimerase